MKFCLNGKVIDRGYPIAFLRAIMGNNLDFSYISQVDLSDAYHEIKFDEEATKKYTLNDYPRADNYFRGWQIAETSIRNASRNVFVFIFREKFETKSKLDSSVSIFVTRVTKFLGGTAQYIKKKQQVSMTKDANSASQNMKLLESFMGQQILITIFFLILQIR